VNVWGIKEQEFQVSRNSQEIKELVGIEAES